MTNFMNMLRDESGASAAEYALILAIIGSVIAIAAIGLSNSIGGAMKKTADCITNPVTPGANPGDPATPSGKC